MSSEQVIEKIKNDFESKHIPEIQRFIKQPSVSADGNGIKETAEMLMKKIQELGGKNVQLADMTKGDFGHPHIYGELIVDDSLPTIVFYSMYDVQPVFPEKWIYDDKKIDPFGAEIIDYEWSPGYSGKCLVGRGVTNQKGPTIAFFNVLESYKEVTGSLPVNILFALEGEEELGSIHMKAFLNEYKEKIKAFKPKLMYFPAFWERFNGDMSYVLGVRGIIPLKVKCKGGSWGGPIGRNLHSSLSGIVENPAFKLMEFITSLKDDETNTILVPGIMNDPKIVNPSEEDEELIKEFLPKVNFEDYKRDLSVAKLRSLEGKELSGRDMVVQQLFKPGISVNGIEGGYYGDGSMTIIPTEVKANLDIRLPPFQEMDYVKECYRKYIKENWPMIEFEFGKGGYESAKVSPNDPIIKLTKKMFESFNKTVISPPLLAGSAPFSIFQSVLHIPFVIGGIGHSGRAHSPLEYAVIKSNKPEVGGIIDNELFVAKLLEQYGKI